MAREDSIVGLFRTVAHSHVTLEFAKVPRMEWNSTLPDQLRFSERAA